MEMMESSSREDFFDFRILFHTHEVNGTLIFNNMSIYQGYFLTVTNKIANLGKKDVSNLNDFKSNKDGMFFTENTLNGVILSLIPFKQYFSDY
jgi:hypothetical protein